MIYNETLSISQKSEYEFNVIYECINITLIISYKNLKYISTNYYLQANNLFGNWYVCMMGKNNLLFLQLVKSVSTHLILLMNVRSSSDIYGEMLLLNVQGMN